MNIYQINTTANREEDFLLLTDLATNQIATIIEPIILAERETAICGYDNSDLVNALRKAYPDNLIQEYTFSNIQTISI